MQVQDEETAEDESERPEQRAAQCRAEALLTRARLSARSRAAPASYRSCSDPWRSPLMIGTVDGAASGRNSPLEAVSPKPPSRRAAVPWRPAMRHRRVSAFVAETWPIASALEASPAVPPPRGSDPTRSPPGGRALVRGRGHRRCRARVHRRPDPRPRPWRCRTAGLPVHDNAVGPLQLPRSHISDDDDVVLVGHGGPPVGRDAPVRPRLLATRLGHRALRPYGAERWPVPAALGPVQFEELHTTALPVA